MDKVWLKSYPEGIPAEVSTPPWRSVKDLFEHSFAAFPDNAAYTNMGTTITYAELSYGVENSARPESNAERLTRFLLPLEVVPFDAEAGRCYGVIRHQLRRAGHPIGANDLLIAAHAMSLDVVIVTNNTREFERVAGLRVERWT